MDVVGFNIFAIFSCNYIKSNSCISKIKCNFAIIERPI